MSYYTRAVRLYRGGYDSGGGTPWFFLVCKYSTLYYDGPVLADSGGSFWVLRAFLGSTGVVWVVLNIIGLLRAFFGWFRIPEFVLRAF